MHRSCDRAYDVRNPEDVSETVQENQPGTFVDFNFVKYILKAPLYTTLPDCLDVSVELDL